MVSLGMEQPFERGESGSKSYLDHEAITSIGGDSSHKEDLMSKRGSYIINGKQREWECCN